MLLWLDNTYDTDAQERQRARKAYNRNKLKHTRCQCRDDFGNCTGPDSCPNSDVYQEDDEYVEN